MTLRGGGKGATWARQRRCGCGGREGWSLGEVVTGWLLGGGGISWDRGIWEEWVKIVGCGCLDGRGSVV